MAAWIAFGCKRLIPNSKPDVSSRGGAFTLWVYLTNKLPDNSPVQEDSSVKVESPILATFVDTAVSEGLMIRSHLKPLSLILSLCRSASLGSHASEQAK